MKKILGLGFVKTCDELVIRNKKKKVTEGFQRQIQILIERNKQLVQENLVLKKEVVQLKNQISVNKTTASRPVIITLDQGYAPVQQQ